MFVCEIVLWITEDVLFTATCRSFGGRGRRRRLGEAISSDVTQTEPELVTRSVEAEEM